MTALRADPLTVPLAHRYSRSNRGFDAGMAAHADAVAAGLPVYRDPVTGLSVFTAAFLAQRGTCCDSGCRHCPYAVGSTR